MAFNFLDFFFEIWGSEGPDPRISKNSKNSKKLKATFFFRFFWNLEF